MKSDVMPSIVQMETEELKTLLNEVKETVADLKNAHEVKPANFGMVNMWNLRKNNRSARALMSRSRS